MAGHSQPTVSPLYWNPLQQNLRVRQSGVVIYSWIEKWSQSSVHCIVHITSPQSPLTSWLDNGQAVSNKNRKGFYLCIIALCNQLNIFYWRRMRFRYHGLKIKLCPMYFKALNCDFTVRSEISTCLLNSYHTCGWLPEKVRLVWYYHLTSAVWFGVARKWFFAEIALR